MAPWTSDNMLNRCMIGEAVNKESNKEDTDDAYMKHCAVNEIVHDDSCLPFKANDFRLNLNLNSDLNLYAMPCKQLHHSNIYHFNVCSPSSYRFLF